MLLSLFIILPLFTGLGIVGLKNSKPIQVIGLLASGILLAVTLYILCPSTTGINLTFNTPWFAFNHVATYFALSAEGLGGLLLLLSTLVYTLLFAYLSFGKFNYDNRFYGLLLITFAGLNGVFLAQDLILFYFFWEIVLIPVLFLIGIWGQEKTRISANLTFFLYTVLGSMLMLAGILFIGYHLKPTSFLLEDVRAVTSDYCNTSLLSLLFLAAFAVKIPLFPFHTWQPDTYKTSPTPVTVVLSALMAKMGLFAVVNWLFGLFPWVSDYFEIFLYIVAFGLLYASFIAMVTNNIKKIIAYSSIAHLALIFLTLYSGNESGGITGAYFQMFSHGLVVLGLWLCIDIIERKYNATDIKSIGGLAAANPTLAIFFMLFALANVALPLTSSFIGEFLMLSALFQYNWILSLIGCGGVIFSAVYTLRLMGSILFGEQKNVESGTKEPVVVYFILAIIVFLILVLGIYPAPVFEILTDI